QSSSRNRTGNDAVTRCCHILLAGIGRPGVYILFTMSRNRRALHVLIAIIISVSAAALIVTCTTGSVQTHRSVVAKQPIIAPTQTCAAIDPPLPAEPSRNVPTLAQATPVAIRQEDLAGKMFVTPDYLTGSRAYIMKKPLGDADTIASMLLTKDDAKRRARAKRLLDSAFALRREGVDELALLERFASPKFAASVEAADAHNLARLRELKKLVAQRDNKRALKRYRDEVRSEYRALKQTQMATWKRYQDDLIIARDRALEEHFGRSAALVKKERPYEAGEYLASTLDLRFSAQQMAAFLVRHLE